MLNIRCKCSQMFHKNGMHDSYKITVLYTSFPNVNNLKPVIKLLFEIFTLTIKHNFSCNFQLKSNGSGS